MSYVGRKSGRAALIAADIPSNLTLLGSHVKIPSVTTANLPGSGDNSSITPVNGMLVYNSTLGLLQQRASGVWSEITTGPVITSFVYSDGASATAENPAGGGVITVTGKNFDSTAAGNSANVGLTFGGTTATSISVNSAKTVITATVPAKAAGTVVMKVLNAASSGLSAETNFIYDTEPVFSTAEAIGSFADGAYTANASAPRIVAAEGADTITYARVTSLTDDTVINTTIAGLTLGSTGYLTGNLAGTNATTYPFYAQATDAENQNTPKLFNIISYDYAATGGTIIEPGAYTGGGYRSHTFTSTGTFVLNVAIDFDYLVVAGGGGGGVNGGGGGGAGGFLTASGYSATIQSYTITVGAGAIARGGTSGVGNSGGNSSIVPASGTSIIAIGGGAGGGASAGTTGGSGGGASYGTHSAAAGTVGQGNAGGAGGGNAPYWAGAGGGGAGAVGTTTSTTDSTNGVNGPGNGGVGLANYYRDGNTSGTTAGIHIFAGGGGAGGDSGIESVGGLGGGGRGSRGGGGQSFTSGTANTGGGGGGNGAVTAGSTGGSGIVIIRYAV